MLDSIYHMTFKNILKSFLGLKTLGFCHMRRHMLIWLIHFCFPATVDSETV